MKIRIFLYGIIGILFILNLSSCTAIKQIDKAMTQRARNQIEQWSQESRIKGEWRNKYIIDVLYVGMPEEEFVRLFRKTSDWTDSKRPYITKHVGSRYIILGLESSYDYRITFKDGYLVKFEYHGHGGGGNPFGYNDGTFLLKGRIK